MDMDTIAKIKAIQGILGVAVDGAWGPRSQAAFDALLTDKPNAIPPSDPGSHVTWASSFADPADVDAFRACKARGGSDQECFRVGDNGIGCWGDDCTDHIPRCALPPEIIAARWGSRDAGRNKLVRITANGVTVQAVLSDVMPHLANITNGCGLDMNPALCAALDLRPPVKSRVVWSWVNYGGAA